MANTFLGMFAGINGTFLASHVEDSSWNGDHAQFRGPNKYSNTRMMCNDDELHFC
jgi:hypothetical protein